MKFLVIDDDKATREATCRMIDREGHHAEPAWSGEAGLILVKQGKFNAVFLDLKSDRERGLDVLRQIIKACINLPVVMFNAGHSIETAVEAMRLGAVDFFERPFAREQFQNVVDRLQRLHEAAEKSRRSKHGLNDTKAANPELLLDFDSPSMRGLNEVLARAARSYASILITGESGTGKSVLARSIHAQSHLADKPFVTVSCPSLSKELLESELFGHIKGSFTGAVSDRWGKVSAANGGTLFLDEIGDLPMELQPKLLRLLQEQEYERVGENVTHNANIRVIAATHHPLKQRIAEGRFREDLYFRLNVIPVEMPPLRTRRADLMRFAHHYLLHFAAECSQPAPVFSSRTLACMENHSWPGNLRELRNAVQRAVILANNREIEPEDLSLENLTEDDITPRSGDLISLKLLKDLHMQKVMLRTGNIAATAKILEINVTTFYRWQKEWASENSMEGRFAAAVARAA